MANVISTLRTSGTVQEQQAYAILHWGFVALPVLAGLDKFARILTNWEQYIAPPVAKTLGSAASGFMLAVGVIEILAGFIVAIRPRIGSLVVAAWLGAIVLNLVIGGRHLDVALRDFGLMLGAVALSRLAPAHDRT